MYGCDALAVELGGHWGGLVELAQGIELLLVDHISLGAVKHIQTTVAFFTREVQVLIAVGQCLGEAVFRRQHLVFLVFSQRSTDQLATVPGQHLQLLTRLHFVQVDHRRLNTGGNLSHRCEDARTCDIHIQRLIGKGVVDQALIAKRCQVGGVRCIADRSAHITGIVRAAGDAKNPAGTHAQRVFQQHLNAGCRRTGSAADAQHIAAHVAVAVNACGLHAVDFFDKTVGHHVQTFLGRLQHLVDESVQAAYGAAACARQRLGIAVRVDHHVELAAGFGIQTDGAGFDAVNHHALFHGAAQTDGDDAVAGETGFDT